MKNSSLLMAIGFLAVSSVFTSCNKDEVTDPISASQVAELQDNLIASSAFDDVDDEVEDATSSNSLKTDSVDSDTKPVVTIVSWEPGKITKQITFNGITRKGKLKSGKINVVITYPTTGDTTGEIGWVRTVTFENYTVNGRKIEGTKTITYLGKVDGTHPEWTITLVDGKITFATGETVTREFTKTRTLIEGYETLIRLDNVYKTNGEGSGVNRKGIAYTTTFTDVVKSADCQYNKSGVIVHESEKKTKTITFTGGDSCSSSATIEVDGKIKTISSDDSAN